MKEQRWISRDEKQKCEKKAERKKNGNEQKQQAWKHRNEKTEMRKQQWNTEVKKAENEKNGNGNTEMKK